MIWLDKRLMLYGNISWNCWWTQKSANTSIQWCEMNFKLSYYVFQHHILHLFTSPPQKNIWNNNIHSLILTLTSADVTFDPTEYGGRWKMLHYYAKDFFSPILASGMIQGGDVYGYSITDRGNLVNASFVTSVWSWTDLKARYQVTNYFSQVSA